jgi:hypothetical protein
MLNGNSPDAAAIPVNEDEPKTRAIKNDSARKYPRTIMMAPAPQAIIRVRRWRLRLEISPATYPSNPFMINVKGAKVPNPPRASDREEPIPPANPPTVGPNVNALMKIIMSPRLKYPWVAGIGIWNKYVERKTSAVKTAVTVIVTTGVRCPMTALDVDSFFDSKTGLSGLLACHYLLGFQF